MVYRLKKYNIYYVYNYILPPIPPKKCQIFREYFRVDFDVSEENSIYFYVIVL